MHRWTDGENVDGLDATWSDDEQVTVDGRGGPARTTRTQRTYTMNGSTTIGDDARLSTVLALGDRAAVVERHGGRRTGWPRLDDTVTGDATYTTAVPRKERHAVGTTSERYRLYGPRGCYDRTLAAVQGGAHAGPRPLLSGECPISSGDRAPTQPRPSACPAGRRGPRAARP